MRALIPEPGDVLSQAEARIGASLTGRWSPVLCVARRAGVLLWSCPQSSHSTLCALCMSGTCCYKSTLG